MIMDQEQQTAPQQPIQGNHPQPASTSAYQEDWVNIPMTVGQWIVTLLLLAIPLVNLILLLVWAFDGSTNVNKRNFARANLILMLIGIGLVLIISILVAILGAAIFSSNSMYY